MMDDFTDRFDLASARLGAAVIDSNDDFFAEKENLLRPGPAVWKEHEYTDRGKWMDGWESRRKRTPGHDWAIVRLGAPGILRGAVVDTAFFRGNFPESCSIEACAAPIDARIEALLDPATEWSTVVARAPLAGDSKNRFAISSPYAFTHVRLNIFPDGGVARLRLHGDVVPDWKRNGHARGEIDLAAVEHGGDVLLASDMFFGERRNLVMPGRAINMSDGWETRRRRGPGSDWAIVRLGAPATLTRLEIDTNHFKGNYPDTCSLEACHAPGASLEDLARAGWRELLPRTKLQAHTRHYFEAELAALGPSSHVRLNVFPDGGVSRLRVHGALDLETRLGLGLQRLDTLPPREARAALTACCASTRWLEAMVQGRPYGSAARLRDAADSAWAAASASDWHEAFAAHPRIGDKPATGSWSAKEQAGMSDASADVRAALQQANQAYEARFGHVYIVCATGKSADELLATIKKRLDNAADEELVVAAAQLHEITRLRLEKLLEP